MLDSAIAWQTPIYAEDSQKRNATLSRIEQSTYRLLPVLPILQPQTSFAGGQNAP
jgi:hypothetical protein